MSTRAIREVLDWVENYLGNEPEAQEARRAARVEVKAIEKAADVLVFEASQYQFRNMNLYRALETMRSIAKEAK